MEKEEYVYEQNWSASDYAFCINEELNFTIWETPDSIQFRFFEKEHYDRYCRYQLEHYTV
jgi:hypothetical protein